MRPECEMRLKVRNSKKVRIDNGDNVLTSMTATQQKAKKFLNFEWYDLTVESAKAWLSLLMAVAVRVDILPRGPVDVI